MGGLGVIKLTGYCKYPKDIRKLLSFHPEAKEKLKLPDGVPEGIVNEFREAEACLENDCFRAAAALFRSVLDKTLRDNGYKPPDKYVNLEKQIDAACQDGLITSARRKKAHKTIWVFLFNNFINCCLLSSIIAYFLYFFHSLYLIA